MKDICDMNIHNVVLEIHKINNLMENPNSYEYIQYNEQCEDSIEDRLVDLNYALTHNFPKLI